MAVEKGDLTARFLGLASVHLSTIVPGSGPLLEATAAEDSSPAARRARIHRGGVRRRTCLDEPELLQLFAAYLDGTPITELAKDFELNESTVHQHLSRQEVPRRPYWKVKPHQVVEAVELYRGGMTLRGVAKHLGVAPDTARPVLVEAGVAIRG